MSFLNMLRLGTYPTLGKVSSRLTILALMTFSFNVSMAAYNPVGDIPEKQIAQQQTNQVTGIVTDSNGEPIIGANVVEKGTTNGIITDMDGKFTLTVPQGASLEISYIGYLSQTIAVKDKKELQITLHEDTQNLDEVVVTALGIKRDKKALGYSTQDLKADDLL